MTYAVDLGITLAIEIAIRLVHQQDARGTGVHDALGRDLSGANGIGGSDTVRKFIIFFG